MVSEMESGLKQVSGVECSSIASGIKNNEELDLSLILLSEGSAKAAVGSSERARRKLAKRRVGLMFMNYFLTMRVIGLIIPRKNE